MKKLIQLFVISITAIILAPAAITILLGNNQQIQEYKLASQSEQEIGKEDQALQEQIIGAIAKEIPISYEEEALKTQAIIARTNIISNQQGLTGSEPLSHMTNEEMKQLWGGDYNRNYKRLKKAVEDTAQCIVTYENQPIQIVYHMQNAGSTQSSEDIWGIQVPYLQGVESIWDKDASDLIREKTYSVDEVIKKLSKEYSDTILEPYRLETQIQIVERTSTGYVKAIQVGNQLMFGDNFRKLLNLQSGCFMMKYEEDKITFITQGIGHGVGLSQYGANEMAKEGKNYEQIIAHYFPDTAIQRIKYKK